MATQRSLTPEPSRRNHDLDFYEHVNTELLLLGGVLAVLSTADIDTYAERVATVCDHLADRTDALRAAVEDWYDHRPTQENAS